MAPRRSSKKSESDSTRGKATNSEQKQEKQKELFPIVAMGASAGGLEAFRQLLSHLPMDTGMAFVLIQHLSPNQKSLLSEILSRTTQMPVCEVQDGMVVEPNHVYVIPPNAKMTISEGVLKLSPREKTRGLFMTVDAFFLSLAEERGSKAIAVVLSGGDADGARGLEAIKGIGGITFAQCEDTAKVTGMPSSAIASGYVDFILPPEAIAQELTNISRHPYIASKTPVKATEALPDNEDALSIIFDLLRTARGVDFSKYKQTTLKRRILRRMVLYKLERLEDYVRYLQENPEEVNALYQDVLITVTSFFRDGEAFETLKTKIFPNIVKNLTPNLAIRIWVAGCSTGEEAYSITICLLEYLTSQGINHPVQIFATDINEVAIDKARNGIYKPSQLADVSPERLQRFFIEVEGGYQISKVVRELCVFARQNLISDPPFSRLDLITCRNVLIYLGSSVQKKLLPIFHYGLKPTGYLMLGTSETVGEFTDLFTLIDRKYKIYSQKIAPGRLTIDLITNAHPTETANPQPTVNENAWNDLEMQKEADRIVLNQYAPVGVVINNDLEILQFRGQTSLYLEPAPGRPSFNLLKMAKEDLRLELRTAIHQAKKQQSPVTKENLHFRHEDRVRQVKVDIIPFKPLPATEDYFLVLFHEILSSITTISQANRDNFFKSTEQQTHDEQEINQLTQELATTKEYLQSIIEEQQATNQDLRAANEEILSSNEELQSTNEELETAKEEIQATNEELNTINDELQRRNLESNQVSNDLQNLLSSINIPILMLGGDLRIRRFTPIAGTIFNLIPTDVGRPLSDINHNLNVPDLEEQIFQVINTLTLKAQEVQDQQGHWYDLRIRPYRTIDNKIDGAVLVLVDIDVLKRTANQLKASRDYAQAIVETVRESLVVLNAELRVVSANLSFYDTFQVIPAQTENRLIFEIGNGQWNIPQLRSLLEEILTNKSQIQDFEVEHNFELIGQKTMRLNGRKMPEIDGTQLILLAIEDITQFKQWEAERAHLLTEEQLARTAAETANRSKDEFLSMLSHELRNPLNALLGWAQLLRSHKLDEETITQGLQAIEHSAKVQAQLIEDLLDISRITSGQLRLDLELIELSIVVESALNLVSLSAESKNIQIESRLEPSTRKILGDAVRLQQVILNLLSNAIKFTPSGGRIEVLLEYIGEEAQIQVNDTGKGIKADFLPYVFDRFRQADSSKTRSNPGLGLGLSIVRHVVELHGGVVEAHSPGEGQGATFIVKLPLQSNLEESSVSNAPERVISTQQLALSGDDMPSLDGLRVLLVDDELHVRELFTTVLEISGVEVTAVASAREALSILMRNPGGYDLLLSDINMPEEDGYTLIHQVRALSVEQGGQIPALAITAHAKDEELTEALSRGFQAHLAKPVDQTQLLILIACLTGRIRRN
ncbi:MULTISPECIES: chemotaxis protein CheB [Nostoc]|uniref:PAS domain-containing protein n=1 Tax=Nostoc paludosum FACHB-159 TaxID=2692908 RepID=A0ABR8K417_9NOSO|nr:MULTISPECIES: chemotaxis protein CheB [Nostoc]MBD2677440.1 PAS domain-containing protein [Nostoc sp. FACHB-857]MBD2734166.1 PAS domain-containing protein [Nostoc paludosum FACHB-159]